MHYIHVLDNNTNLTRVVEGPQTFTRQEHEQVVSGPHRMITIPPRSYCKIANPVIKNDDGEVVKDDRGNYTLRHGDHELRFEQDPFPLYPGEKLYDKVSKLKHVKVNQAYLLRALRDFTDEAEGKERVAGDEWLFVGPQTYIPRIEVEEVTMVSATVVKQNFALKLCAKRNTVDANGVARSAGEEWLHRQPGAYMPGVNERIVAKVPAVVLTDKRALHLRATRTFTDVFGEQRKAGDEWLVTMDQAEMHIPDVYEERIGEIRATTLTNRQYCIVLDPIDPNTRKPRLGYRELRKGECTFFLHPGESLEHGRIENIQVLGEDEALLLRARSTFKDTDGKEYCPGQTWMISGPCDFVPPVEVEIVEKRKAIPLDENEGIYVRDISTGEVRSVHGESYMLRPNEQLWEKHLSPVVEALLRKGAVRDSPSSSSDQFSESRDKTRVVTYRAPHNSAVQIYDYKKKESRIVFGPQLVMLGADEAFTVLSLSGERPKTANVIQSLTLLLGPDFMTDLIVVETSDHARLQLQLAYNWHFEVDRSNKQDCERLFSVPDFVGDCCKAIASRVRGAVASTTFEHFHKNAIQVINRSVFGVDSATGETRNRLVFSANNLVVSNIDIQEVEPVDQKTRDSLQKSVQLAIEITTRSQEAQARREAERKEQEAAGQLERQRIEAEAQAEEARKDLIDLRAKSLVVEHSGAAKAEAKAKAAAEKIKAQAAVTQSTLEAETLTIKSSSDNAERQLRYQSEVDHQRAIDQMEIDRAEKLAKIEATKFAEIVDAIGPDTIKSIARAGPEMQAKLLKGLGLKSFLITDGNSPINLFSTASGLIGTPGSAASKATNQAQPPTTKQPADAGITGLDDTDFDL